MRRTHSKDKWTVKAYERHLKSQGKRVPVKQHTAKRGTSTARNSKSKPRKMFGLF